MQNRDESLEKTKHGWLLFFIAVLCIVAGFYLIRIKTKNMTYYQTFKFEKLIKNNK